MAVRCAIWSAALQRKQNLKLLRSVQRTAAIFITRSFKSVSTESLLIMPNLFPIDLKIFEITALRYFSKRDPQFSSSSEKHLKKVLPSVPFMPRIEQTASPHSNGFPSWIFNYKIGFISPNETVSLASAENGTVRVYPCGFHEGTSAGFCIVATDATGIANIQHGSLEVDTIYQVSSFAILFVNQQTIYSKAEIFVPSLSTLSFINHVRVSRLETLWNEEWVRSPNGEYTRSFFPNVKSARSLLTLTMDRATAQIISGHSLLKSHQHRFGFVGNPSCECGYRSETIDQFLFSCPLFHSLRYSFATTSLKITNSWPPPLSAVPQNMDLRSVFRQFLRSSKRLSLSNTFRYRYVVILVFMEGVLLWRLYSSVHEEPAPPRLSNF